MNENENIIQCRASNGVALNTSQPWEAGKPVSFIYAPAGQHNITAGFRKGETITICVVNDEQTALDLQASFDHLTATEPQQEPFSDEDHDAKKATLRFPASVTKFSWGDIKGNQGIVVQAEPTSYGAEAVNGKVYRSWSPEFATDADYSKASQKNGHWTFPDGVRGSESNPARIVGVSFVMGALTNRPAFRAMPPVKARKQDVIDAAKPKDIPINDTEHDTWNERDRLHFDLKHKKTGKTIHELWDDDARQAVEDGFIDPRNLHESHYEYAQHLGLIKSSEPVKAKKADGDRGEVQAGRSSLQDLMHRAEEVHASKAARAGTLGDRARKSGDVEDHANALAAFSKARTAAVDLAEKSHKAGYSDRGRQAEADAEGHKVMMNYHSKAIHSHHEGGSSPVSASSTSIPFSQLLGNLKACLPDDCDEIADITHDGSNCFTATVIASDEARSIGFVLAEDGSIELDDNWVSATAPENYAGECLLNGESVKAAGLSNEQAEELLRRNEVRRQSARKRASDNTASVLKQREAWGASHVANDATEKAFLSDSKEDHSTARDRHAEAKALHERLGNKEASSHHGAMAFEHSLSAHDSGVKSSSASLTINGETYVRASESGYLVSKDGEQHLPTHKNGKPDARLMGAAHAALTGGYRGRKYEGPDKEKALSKLKKLYEDEGMEWPGTAKASDAALEDIYVKAEETESSNVKAAEPNEEGLKEHARLDAENAREWHHKTKKNADGTPMRVRRNGKTQTWKTRPGEFRIPVKYGLYEYGEINHNTSKDWNPGDGRVYSSDASSSLNQIFARVGANGQPAAVSN
ncbi:MAG: hypothetical protein KGL39_33650 [Patescibacteria group bacterium]|nr:hypothetical protein [Patescibacteria group bacterium]